MEKFYKLTFEYLIIMIIKCSKIGWKKKPSKLQFSAKNKYLLSEFTREYYADGARIKTTSNI